MTTSLKSMTILPFLTASMNRRDSLSNSGSKYPPITDESQYIRGSFIGTYGHLGAPHNNIQNVLRFRLTRAKTQFILFSTTSRRTHRRISLFSARDSWRTCGSCLLVYPQSVLGGQAGFC